MKPAPCRHVPMPTGLYVGEDVIFAPKWATHVWRALVDGHLYFVGPSDLEQMPLGVNADTRELY